MEKLIINGGRKLVGEINVNGGKNAAVAIIPAVLLASEETEIKNLPHISDTKLLVDILKKMGVKCEFIGDVLRVTNTQVNDYKFDFDEVSKMRASYYFIGALLGKYKKAELPLPGGCNLGSRPIDQHIKAFELLGATVKIEHGIIKVEAEKLVGTKIYLDVISVGATINTMLAAVLAEGETIIENAAKEPHVVDLADFLNKMGAKVQGAGTDVIVVEGVKKLDGCTHVVIPDQIEAGTYMVAAAITGGDVTIKNVDPKHMESITAKLKEANVEVIEIGNTIRIVGKDDLVSMNVKTLPYPGFPTDMQSQMGALLSIAKGTSMITETIWANRFRYTDGLNRMGAKIKSEGSVAVIKGVDKLTGAKVTAPDLRGGVALVLAGLVAEGVTEISNIEHIDRGYEEIEEKLNSLGASIKRIEE
ncbi:MAG TPA: UDP-N-acetylglucosamine 1-carboxyvinyltransferase [Clostridiales bacterium]|nr:MAG: UDP-N-acetylglucosamine 1-carboxyvinyltransferase [Clostridiales bacterium GWD2_32_59]HAN10677.1 UDP-N-acetylglucosamine 1-carboxyvinyltransferase [Clostridiales bacterium]